MSAKNLHFTSIIGMSKRDAKVIRKKILKLLQEVEKDVQASEPEAPFVMSIDYYGL
jgi:hypothetical protein